MALNIVLVEPEIPQNTGNIARTCAAIGATLHLVKPLGFSIDEKQVRRAGLDYWHLLDLKVYENLEEFLLVNKDKKMYFATTKADKTYCDVSYENDCFILFGKETKGLPEELLYERMDTAVRIPMISDARSLNLSNSVAIIAYEAMRQNNFSDLQNTGKLTKF
ncbi:MAG: tRNA (uridine(34)/cytosine(34)/5-carboxymethylaminomethyluridine(34)-2'-O)-methyltransferase TrmL [Ruminococcaceae bacterium]|nr:tRNA (uridine(34)/cytosine(34)/5-carboxymethylaminomethyluridine(34)-2'-O)-methyltransferase TrmL [Oscillospiraceae bacterium]